MTFENICEAARMGVSLSGCDAKALVDALDEMEAVAERWEDRCGHQTIRADDLSRMVAAMGEVLEAAKRKAERGWMVDDHACVECVGDEAPKHMNGWKCARHSVDAILSRPDVAAERGRWKTVEEVIDLLTRAGLALGVHSMMGLDAHIKRVREDFDAIITERDAASAHAEKAYAAAEEAENDLGVIVEAIRTHFPHYVSVTDGDEFSPVETVEEVAREFKVLGQRLADVEADRRVVSAATYAQRAAERDEAYAERDEEKARADAAERSRDELGIQLAAAQERLRLAMACVKAGDALIIGCLLAGGAGSKFMVRFIEEANAARAALDAVPGDALVTSTKKDGE